MLETLLIIAIEIALVIWQWRRWSFYPYPTGIMLYIIGGQMVLAMASVELVEYPFLSLYSNYAFMTDLATFNILLFLYFMTVLATAISQPMRRVKFNLIRQQFAEAKLSGWIINLALVGVWGHMVLFWLVLDPAPVWANKQYLLMGHPDILRSPNLLAVLVLQLWSLVAMMTGMLFGFTLCQRSTTSKVFGGITFVWYLAYALGAHSRVSVLMLMICAAVIYVRGRRRLGAVFLTLGILAMPFVLQGRNEVDHGISVLATLPVDVVAALVSSSGATLLNPFEGIFIFTELFDYNAQFPVAYQVLSLLPSVSALDGFNEIRDIYQVRLHFYAPASSILELSKFNPPLIAYYLFVTLLAGRISVRLLSRDRSPASLLANFLVFVIMYLQFTYPVRTVFRLEYVALLLMAFEAARQRRMAIKRADARLLTTKSNLRSRRKKEGDNAEPVVYPASRAQRSDVAEQRSGDLPRSKRRNAAVPFVPRAFR